MKARSAGRLRWQVQLQSLPSPSSPLSRPNDFNEPNYDPSQWTSYATVWACIRPLSGRELLWAREIVADVTHNVELRYLKGILPKHRILYQDMYGGQTRVLNILAVMDDEERHRWLDLLCRESV